MIPPDLSKKAMDVFREMMQGKILTDKIGGKFHFTEDAQTAIDAVVEMTLQWAQEKLS